MPRLLENKTFDLFIACVGFFISVFGLIFMYRASYQYSQEAGIILVILGIFWMIFGFGCYLAFQGAGVGG